MHPPAIFSSYVMDHYYVILTVQACKCGNKEHNLLSQKVFVQCYGTRKNQHLTQPVEEILRRYMKLFAVGEEEAKTLLPELPFIVKEYELPVEWCTKCFQSTYGNPTGLPPMMPQPREMKAGPLESPNADISKRINAEARRKSGSKKIQPKKASSRKTARMEQLTNGPLEGLL